MAIQIINGNYYELIDSESPSIYTFTNKNSGSVITFLVNAEDILTFINDVLGSAYLKNNSYVSRSIPASHPMFPWQYASSISDIKGYTPYGKQETSVIKADTNFKNIITEAPPYAGFYKQYKITVTFESRSYFIYTNEDIEKQTSVNSYAMPITLKDDVVGEEIYQYIDRFEYSRYTNFDWIPSSEVLTWGNEQYTLFGSENTDWNSKPIPATGNNNTIIPKIKLSWNWYFVPYELTINNKIWTDAYSKLNLEPIYEFIPKGSLLLTEIKVNKYEPYYPFNKIYLTDTSSVFDYFTEYNKNQYCDVSFIFSLFLFPPGTVGNPAAGTYMPHGAKDPRSPHNKLLYPGNLVWYYFESSQDQTKGRPLFWNYPMQNLYNYVEGA